ncbi:hypothetical protein ACXHPT_15670, partial [Vibrio cincinnatiensis]
MAKPFSLWQLRPVLQPGLRLLGECSGVASALIYLITTNFKLTKESIMAILFTKEEAMKDLPFIEDKAL